MLRKIRLISTILVLVSCSNIKESQTFSFLALNTTCSVTIYNSVEIDMESIKDFVIEIENLMSTTIETSDVYKINSLAGVDFYTPDPRTLEVIKKGIEFGELSKGDFDISIGPLVKLWDINNKSRVPLKSDIEINKSFVNYKNIIIENDRVMLKNSSMSIDLGGIAKGYASFGVKELLKSYGVKSAIINLGGNLDLLGVKANGQPWNIGIQHPREDRGKYIGIIKVNDTSFVSSGDYERFFIENGVRYHHILSSKTGCQKRGEVISSSIITPIATNGDALSTITFGKSIDEIKEFMKIVDFEGVFITEDKRIYITDGIRDIFTLKDETYKIIQ